MITDADLKVSQLSVTAAATAGTAVVSKSDVIDLGVKELNLLAMPKGAKIVVTLGAAMTNANSYLKLAYGDELTSGNIATPKYSPEQFAGASGATQKVFAFSLDSLEGVACKYLQVVIGNAVATATTLDAELVLESPHNSGAFIV